MRTGTARLKPKLAAMSVPTIWIILVMLAADFAPRSPASAMFPRPRVGAYDASLQNADGRFVAKQTRRGNPNPRLLIQGGTPGDMVLDEARRQIFVTKGRSSKAVFVYDYYGRVTRRIDVHFPSGLELVDGQLFIAERGTDSIVVVDVGSLEVVDRISISPLAYPHSVVVTGDILWFSYNCANGNEAGLGSVDLTTGVVRNHEGSPTELSHYQCPGIWRDPADSNSLYLGWTGSIEKYNIVTGEPIQVLSRNISYRAVEIAPDGEVLLVALSNERSIEVLGADDLQTVDRYPTVSYPVALDIDTAGTRLAVANTGGDIRLFRIGRKRPILTIDGHRDVAVDGGRGLAVTGSGNRLFLRLFSPRSRLVPLVPAIPIRQRSRADELIPAAGPGLLTWTELRFNGRSVVFVKQWNGRVRRVSPKHTRAFSGGVDGHYVVYQEIENRDSDIRFYNFETARRSWASGVINSRHWEWRPTSSGRWLMFGRTARSSAWVKLLLYDRKTRELRQLASSRTEKGWVFPGQVNRNFAVFDVCKPVCNVYRYDLKKRKRQRVPNPLKKHQYGGAVDSNGTVYFVRGGGCRVPKSVMAYSWNGSPAQLLPLPRLTDTWRMFAYTRESGATNLVFDQFACESGFENWGIYGLVDD